MNSTSIICRFGFIINAYFHNFSIQLCIILNAFIISLILTKLIEISPIFNLCGLIPNILIALFGPLPIIYTLLFYYILQKDIYE